MKRFFVVAAFVAAILAVNVVAERKVVGEAAAADMVVAQLTSSDAGPTNIYTFPFRQQNYEIWCQIPSCYKTDTLVSGVLGDAGISCSVDVPACTLNPAGQANLNATGCAASGLPRFKFSNGIHTGIWALAADGGNPNCTLSIVQGAF